MKTAVATILTLTAIAAVGVAVTLVTGCSPVSAAFGVGVAVATLGLFGR